MQTLAEKSLNISDNNNFERISLVSYSNKELPGWSIFLKYVNICKDNIMCGFSRLRWK